MRNFVNLNQLSTQAITSLIVASLAYKNGEKDLPQMTQHVANLFLKIQHVPLAAFKWLKINWAGRQLISIQQRVPHKRGKLKRYVKDAWRHWCGCRGVTPQYQ